MNHPCFIHKGLLTAYASITGTGATTGHRIFEAPNANKGTVNNVDTGTPLRAPVKVVNMRLVRTTAAAASTRVALYDLQDGAATATVTGDPVAVLILGAAVGSEAVLPEGFSFAVTGGLYALPLTNADAFDAGTFAVTTQYHMLRDPGEAPLSAYKAVTSTAAVDLYENPNADKSVVSSSDSAPIRRPAYITSFIAGQQATTDGTVAAAGTHVSLYDIGPGETIPDEPIAVIPLSVGGMKVNNVGEVIGPFHKGIRAVAAGANIDAHLAVAIAAL